MSNATTISHMKMAGVTGTVMTSAPPLGKKVMDAPPASAGPFPAWHGLMPKLSLLLDVLAVDGL